MFIPVVTFPGMRAKNDPEMNLTVLLEGCTRELAKAAIALEEFNSALAMQRESLRRAMGDPLPDAESTTDAGLPPEYERQKPFLYAEAFVGALKSINNYVQRISVQPGVPAAVADALNVFNASVPGVTDVRDSLQHRDERALRTTEGRAIEPHALDGPMVRAPAGSVMLLGGNLENDVFRITASDGSNPSIPIRNTTCAAAQALVQSAVDALEWDGPPKQYPYLRR